MISIWNETAIPTLRLRNIVLKIESLKKKFETLKKTRFRRTETQLKREIQFREFLDKMFDITSQATLSLSQEQRQLLADQRQFRQLNIYSIKSLAGPLILRKKFEADDLEINDSSEMDSDGSDFEDSLSEHERISLTTSRPPILETMLNSTDVSSALDRTNTTSGEFTILASAIARACGEEINESTLSVPLYQE